MTEQELIMKLLNASAEALGIEPVRNRPLLSLLVDFLDERRPMAKIADDLKALQERNERIARRRAS